MFSAEGLAQLVKWGLTAQDAEQAGIFEVEDASQVYSDFDKAPALIIPYFQPNGEPVAFDRDGEELAFCRLRYLNPPQQTGFTVKKAQRYSQPGASGTHAYFGPGLEWERMRQDVQEACIITEGEAKALAGIKHGFPVIALGGVYSFTNGGDELMPELDAWKWRGRDAYICFDSDALSNPNILAAEARLVDELQRKRGARCFLIRLPAEGDEKIGLDDFLVKYGAPAFEGLLKAAPFLGALDAKVVSLNKEVAWIEAEGAVYDLVTKGFIRKDSFVKGSRFSALKHITVGGKQRSEPKEISVADKWLTHPHAQRFGQVLFKPGADRVTPTTEGQPALNIWTGWQGAIPGDVRPFLDLTEFLFSNMEPATRDLPLKLMAYKVQNPDIKFALALVLLGDQGSGKTMWAEILREAFMPYAEAVNPSAFKSSFQGWMEKALLVTVNEMKGEDVKEASEEIKGLISDKRRMMNEKYRPARQIDTYFQFIITSNQRAVGSFSADDRRMVVVNCPRPRPHEFYTEYLVPWIAAGGPKKVLHFLQHYNLKGWTPPARAPMTAEKHLAYVEGLSSIQALAEDMKTSNEHTVLMWMEKAAKEAEAMLMTNDARQHGTANATLSGLKHMQVRPWYEPRELAMLFPNICATLLGSRYDRTTPPGQLSRELREAGVPYLVCADDPTGFTWKGSKRQFLVVTDFDEWRDPLSQADFERLMAHWPAYADYRQKGRAS